MNYGILKAIERDVAEECNASVRAYLRIGKKIIINDADEGDVPLAEDFYDSILRGERSSFGGSEIRHRNGFFCIDIVYVRGCVTLAADPLYEVLFMCFSSQTTDELYLRDMLDHIETLCVYPKEPRLLSYSAENAVDAMSIYLSPLQSIYACDVKSALCYAYANGFESYVLTEGLRSIGIAVLNVKEGCGKIEYVAVDKKHQLKGYGRILAKQCIKRLKECGCRDIYISVHEHNLCALHVYEEAGFTEEKHEGDTILMKLQP